MWRRMTRKALGIVVVVLLIVGACDRMRDDERPWTDRLWGDGTPSAEKAPTPPPESPPVAVAPTPEPAAPAPAPATEPAKKSVKKKKSCGSGRMRCGGVCVDYRNDPKNCNACGRTCPEACMGGSCVSNAYKYGG
jgi:hypothetical protein